MKRRIFEDEIGELGAHVATVDALIGVLRERIVHLEALKTRAVTVQAAMQDFCERLAAQEAAVASETMDACATHAAPATSN